MQKFGIWGHWEWVIFFAETTTRFDSCLVQIHLRFVFSRRPNNNRNTTKRHRKVIFYLLAGIAHVINYRPIKSGNDQYGVQFFHGWSSIVLLHRNGLSPIKHCSTTVLYTDSVMGDKHVIEFCVYDYHTWMTVSRYTSTRASRSAAVCLMSERFKRSLSLGFHWPNPQCLGLPCH